MKALCIGLMVLFSVFNTAGCAKAQVDPLAGKPLRDFTLERLSGTSTALSRLVQGKKAIMFFFATWCPHCREQFQALAAQKAQIEAQGVVIVLVDIGEPKDKVARFLKAAGVDNDAFLDKDSRVAEIYQVMGIPTLVFIARDGVVRGVEYGLPDNYLEILK